MRFDLRLPLSLSLIVLSVTPSWASSVWDCPPEVAVPEIDGPAGMSALAALISIGMIAYRRYQA